jgi:hypothetical protein
MEGMFIFQVILGLDPRICPARDPRVKPEDDAVRMGVSQ